jgi:hypothetical protein
MEGMLIKFAQKTQIFGKTGHKHVIIFFFLHE